MKRRTLPLLLLYGAWTCSICSADQITLAPGEKHWHGTTSEGPMTHLAVNLGKRTDWMEAVEVGGEVP